MILALGNGFHGAGGCSRGDGAKVATGEICSGEAAWSLRGTPASSGATAPYCTQKRKEKRLEMRRDMGNGVESSKWREVDGIDRKQEESATERAAPASDWGGLGAWFSWESRGISSYGGGVDIGAGRL